MVSLPESPLGLDLNRRDRLVFYYFVGLSLIIVTFTIGYNQVMWRLEGEGQSIAASLEFVVQTMTTTGYGQDSGTWSHWFTFLFVATTQITGIGIGFFTLRLIIVPLINEVETSLDDRLTPKSDHVIVCDYRRDSAVLLDELTELGIDYVFVDTDEAEARELSDDGYSVIHGSPQDASSFERASVEDARAVVVDVGDANVNAILTARSVRPDVDVIALVDDSDMRDVLLDAGADSVLSPHGVLGHRLAEKVVATYSTDLIDTIELGEDLGVTEVPIQHGSDLAGKRIRDAGLRERASAQIVGAWVDGELQLPPDPDTLIRTNTTLIVSGDREALADMTEFTRAPRSFRRPERVVVAGMGEVGGAADAVIREAGIETVTIDVVDREGVDIVADAASKDVLREADIEDAGAVVVAVPDDATGLLTTVLARSMNPNVEVLTRVSDLDATAKAMRAGADYVLSVPRISARMTAKELRGEDVVDLASQVRVVRVPATPFAGTALADAGIYETTGCRVVAVQRDGDFSTDVDPSRPFSGDERLVIVGTDESVQQFLKRYDVPESTTP
jgi:Trk K+ transport system NAD-binding subunit